MARTTTVAKAADNTADQTNIEQPVEQPAAQTPAEQPTEAPAEQPVDITLAIRVRLLPSQKDALIAALSAQIEDFETHELKVTKVTSTTGAYRGDGEKFWYEKGRTHGEGGKPFDEAIAAEHPRYVRGFESGTAFRARKATAEAAPARD